MAKQSIKEVLCFDNPGGNWLKHEQERVQRKMKDAGPGSSLSKGFIGSVTASTRKPVFLPLRDIVGMRGAMDERPQPGTAKYDQLKERVALEGWDPDQNGNAIIIAVNHLGQAYLLEGNHRVDIANQNDVEHIKAEVRYWNGGEDVEISKWSPDRLISRIQEQPEPDHGLSL